MRRAATLYSSSIGKKVTMALTGAVLYAYVVFHMAGNLKIFQGSEKFDTYAAFLREVGSPVFGHEQLLWFARIVLLISVLWHMLAALQTYLMSRAARDVGYRKSNSLSFSYASHTMRWGGLVILAFVIYHLLHLTVGTVHPEFSQESVYQNVVSGFKVWYVSLFYMLAMIPLGFHMYHGVWSACQTLDINNPKIQRWRRPFSAAVAVIVVIGNVSVPLAVLTGLVR